MGIAKRDYGNGVHGHKRKCLCPKCGKFHTLHKNYIGPAEYPPYFCQVCLHNLEMMGYYDTEEPYQTQVRI